MKTSLQLSFVLVVPKNYLPLSSFILEYTVLFIFIILFSKSISSQVNANTSPVLIPVVKKAHINVLLFLNLNKILSISSWE